MTEFVVQAIREKTASVIDEKEHVTLSRSIFDDFIAACEQDVTLGSALKQAAADHDAKGFA